MLSVFMQNGYIPGFLIKNLPLLFFSLSCINLGMDQCVVVDTCNPNTQEAESGAEARVGYLISSRPHIEAVLKNQNSNRMPWNFC